MLSSEHMPKRPNRAKSLDSIGAQLESSEVPPRGLDPTESATDESLFGNFVKCRQDAAADTEVEEAALAMNLQKVARRGRTGAKSPDLALDPNPSSISKGAASKYHPRHPTSPRSSSSKSSHGSSSGKSPGKLRAPAGMRAQLSRSPRDSKKVLQKNNREGPSSSPLDGDETVEETDGTDSLPDLVEDSVIRWTMEGKRGGKQWNIMEDTPGGHAEEKLNIVDAIECDDESADLKQDDTSLLEEDDTIADYPDEHSLVVARARKRNSLPSDPRSADPSLHIQNPSSSDRDRFDPSFNNSAMWKRECDVGQPLVHRVNSGDVSLLSDAHGSLDLELISELGSSSLLDIMDEHAVEAEEDPSDVGGQEGTAAKTPATKKRSGGRRLPSIHPAPNLETESFDYEEEDDSHPISVPEDGPLDSSSRHRVSRRRRPPSSRASGRHEKKGSSSTGRSSQRRMHKDRDPMRGRRHKKVPDSVPATPIVDEKVRSPLSSSLTSTPNSNSLLSSFRSQQQYQSLQTLRQQHSNNVSPPRKRAGKPLNLHVERGRDRSPSDGDEHTLGASTITTNFSTTQRTRGDNTVSTRSLFQSERMNHHESLRIPQRRRAGSESDESHSDKLPPQPPKRTDDDLTSELYNSAELEGIVEDNFIRSTPLKKPSLQGDELRPGLRRPTGGDEMLATIKDAFQTQNSTSSDGLSLGSSISSGFLKWHKENGTDLLSPKPPTIQQHSGVATDSKPFLQINPGVGSQGIVVDAKIAVAPNSTKITTTTTSSGGGEGVLPGVSDNPIHTATEREDGQDKFEVESTPKLISERIYGVGQESHSPTTEFGKKSRRKSRLGLFRRVQSWKGVVRLDDEEEDDDNVKGK